MNAYELANELQKHGLNGDNHGLFNKRIQNMLRQLADELKACKIHDRRGWEYAEELEQERRKQADRIAELEKEITRLIGAEPITYGTFTVCKNCGQQDPYTQTKPLSDEEIFNCWSDDNELDCAKEILEFARAIEAKVRG